MRVRNRDAAYFNEFSRKSRSYWLKYLFGTGGLLGLCKLGNTVNQIFTNDIVRHEIASNSGFFNQYFRELSESLRLGTLPANQIPEVILPTLGLICIVAPITLSLGAIAKKVIDKNK